VAPTQVVIVPIWRKDADRGLVEQAVDTTRDALSSVARTFVDRRDDKSPGWKFNEWELKGVPVRLEIGPRDVENQQVTLVRRDTRERQAIPVAELVERIPAILREIQANMFAEAKRMLTDNTEDVAEYERLQERAASNAGFSRAWWCGNADCEAKVKQETRATIRCIPFEQSGGSGSCLVCGETSDQQVIFARAY
jgi:prolyl-tRNA synthetase